MIIVIAFYRNEINQDFNPKNNENWGDFTYEKSLNWLKLSLKKYESIQLKILTDTKTRIEGFNEQDLIRVETSNYSLMTAIVISEAYAIKKYNNHNIIFCGPDEIFINDPSVIFEEKFDLKLPIINYARIINAVVFVRSNLLTQDFYNKRIAALINMDENNLNWGADMLTYEKVLSNYSFKIKLLTYFSEHTNKSNNILIKFIRKLFHYILLKSNIQISNKSTKLLLSFYDWNNKYGGSISINSEVDLEIKRTKAKKWIFLDFKGRQRKKSMSSYIKGLEL